MKQIKIELSYEQILHTIIKYSMNWYFITKGTILQANVNVEILLV
jgi:hypothetical protein